MVKEEIFGKELSWTKDLNSVKDNPVGLTLNLISGFKPVSYTHLDVYKRQYLGILAKPL